MRFSDFLKQARVRLYNQYDEAEAFALSRMILEEISGSSRSSWLINDEEISVELFEKLNDAVNRLLKHEPIQYILGYAYFHKFRFEVGPGVLIPRPETEDLLSLILSEQKSKTKGNLIDLGCGSGCLTISLQNELSYWKIHGMDISPQALHFAQVNSERLQSNVCWHLHSMHAPETFRPNMLFDVIVSNPPYIPISERMTMPKNVVENEPESALFVPDTDALLFYRSAIQFASHHLSEKGTMYFEIHESLGKPCQALFQAHGFGNTKLFRDRYGKERMLRAEK